MKKLPTYQDFVNEATASKDAMDAYNSVMELDSPDMETFFGMLTDYFKRNQEGLSNMDAKKITAHLQSVHDLIKKRTGN